MNIIVFDGPEREDLLPLTYTRPVAEIRAGILTLRKKWEYALGSPSSSTHTSKYLRDKWPLFSASSNLFINPSFIPTRDLIQAIKELSHGEKLIFQERIIAYRAAAVSKNYKKLRTIELKVPVQQIRYPWDLFKMNFDLIKQDFKLLTQGRDSQPVPDTFEVFQKNRIFIEEGARLYSGTLNAENGPIYIGRGAEIREGAHIRGPFAMGAGAQVQMGSRIYEGTTIGPKAVVGGEVKNALLFGHSNKGHDGYLGNAVVGEWCNLGAGTNASNLKNDYGPVRIWNYKEERFISTGLQKCGLIMGDHSKTGIHTMFNTGTVVGVNANIFGSGFPRNFIPSFSWGGKKEMRTYRLEKAFQVAKNMMDLEEQNFSITDQKILKEVFDRTAKYRAKP